MHKEEEMMKKAIFVLLTVLCCALLMNCIPVTHATTDYFTNSVVIIMGKCDTVTSPALWLFGFKVLFNKRVIIQANGGEDEKINALILPAKIGFYFGQENVMIHMEGTKGLFFRGEKSLFFQNTTQRIFAVCKVRDIWVTHDY